MNPNVEKMIAGTDGDGDYQALWQFCYYSKPKVVVELGTRTAISTHVLKDACPEAEIYTCDINDCSARVPAGVHFIHQNAYQLALEWKKPIDLLFVDTDPHSYEQTNGWLRMWLPFVKGVALWHDSRTSGVGVALKEWLATHSEWKGYEAGSNNGMFVLMHSGRDGKVLASASNTDNNSTG